MSKSRELIVVSGEKGKGRSFRAAVLAMASAPVWDKHEGNHERVRPAFVMLGCQSQEAGPVMANLRSGHVANMYGEGCRHDGVAFEMLKSAKYSWTTQRTEAGMVATARLHSVVALDPGIGELDQPVRFIVVPPRDRLEAELLKLPAAEMLAYGEKLVGGAFKKGPYDWMKPELTKDQDEWRYAPAMALWFCAMVDRRVSAPILPDPLFQFRFYLACLREGIASWNRWDGGYSSRDTWGRRGPQLQEWGYDQVGLAPGVACKASQEQIRELLVTEVRAWNESDAGQGIRSRAGVRVVKCVA